MLLLQAAPLAELLLTAAAAGEQQASLLLNVIAALTMLARDGGMPAVDTLLRPEGERRQSLPAHQAPTRGCSRGRPRSSHLHWARTHATGALPAALAVLSAVLGAASPQRPEQLQAAAVEALCAVCSAGPQQQQHMLAAGALEAAASLLATPSADVAVLALMVLGMLVTPERPEAQAALAAAPLALQQLLALMTQSADADCRVIARDLLGVLRGGSPETKLQVEAALRQRAAPARQP